MNLVVSLVFVPVSSRFAGNSGIYRVVSLDLEQICVNISGSGAYSCVFVCREPFEAEIWGISSGGSARVYRETLGAFGPPNPHSLGLLFVKLRAFGPITRGSAPRTPGGKYLMVVGPSRSKMEC